MSPMTREEYLALALDRLNVRIEYLVSLPLTEVKRNVIDMYRAERDFLVEQWELEQVVSDE